MAKTKNNTFDIQKYKANLDENYQLKKSFRTEIKDNQYIKAGNVIVIHFKNTDFICFDAFIIDEVRPRYIQSHLQFCIIGRFNTINSQRFYLRVDDNGSLSDDSNNESSFIDILVNFKTLGDKVEVYTKQEYDDYIMLIQTETLNIINSRSKYYKQISQKYEKIYNNTVYQSVTHRI